MLIELLRKSWYQHCRIVVADCFQSCLLWKCTCSGPESLFQPIPKTAALRQPTQTRFMLARSPGKMGPSRSMVQLTCETPCAEVHEGRPRICTPICGLRAEHGPQHHDRAWAVCPYWRADGESSRPRLGHRQSEPDWRCSTSHASDRLAYSPSRCFRKAKSVEVTQSRIFQDHTSYCKYNKYPINNLKSCINGSKTYWKAWKLAV